MANLTVLLNVLVIIHLILQTCREEHRRQHPEENVSVTDYLCGDFRTYVEGKVLFRLVTLSGSSSGPASGLYVKKELPSLATPR